MAETKDDHYEQAFEFMQDLASGLGLAVPTVEKDDDLDTVWGVTQASQYGTTAD
jgi:hypothetical protein